VRIARPDLRKWSQRLERALPAILRSVPALRFVFMAAPGSKVEALRRRYGSRLIFLPPTDDLDRLTAIYAACDLMVHSSGIGETFGTSLAEGMYWRLPVVVDSTPDLDNAQIEVVDHGVTGLVTASGAGFAEAILRLASDVAFRQRLGAAARAKVQARYADLVVTRQWERVLIASMKQSGFSAPTAGLLDYGRQIDPLPAAGEYRSFEDEYRRRLTRVTGPLPSVREMVGQQARRIRDTLAFLRYGDR
jgi:hypothetical protein